MHKLIPILALLGNASAFIAVKRNETGLPVCKDMKRLGSKAAAAVCNLGHNEGGMICLSTVTYVTCPKDFSTAVESEAGAGRLCVQAPGKMDVVMNTNSTVECEYYSQVLGPNFMPHAVPPASSQAVTGSASVSATKAPASSTTPVSAASSTSSSTVSKPPASSSSRVAPAASSTTTKA